MQAELKLKVIELAHAFSPLDAHGNTDTTDLAVQSASTLLKWFESSALKGGQLVAFDQMYTILATSLMYADVSTPIALCEYADRILEWIAGVTQKSRNTPINFDTLFGVLEMAWAQPNSRDFNNVLKRANKYLAVLDHGPRTR